MVPIVVWVKQYRDRPVLGLLISRQPLKVLHINNEQSFKMLDPGGIESWNRQFRPKYDTPLFYDLDVVGYADHANRELTLGQWITTPLTPGSGILRPVLWHNGIWDIYGRDGKAKAMPLKIVFNHLTGEPRWSALHDPFRSDDRTQYLGTLGTAVPKRILIDKHGFYLDPVPWVLNRTRKLMSAALKARYTDGNPD